MSKKLFSIKLPRTSDWSKQGGQCITHIRLDTTLLPEWLYSQIDRSHLSGTDTRISLKHLTPGSAAVAAEKQSLQVANMWKVPKTEVGY